MTIQEIQAQRIEQAAKLLAFWLGTMPTERQSWKPELPDAAGLRTPLEMLAECTAVNHMIAGLLQGAPPPTTSPLEAKPAGDTAAVQQALVASGAALAAAIRGMSDEDLTREFTTRRGPMRGFQLIDMPYRNMSYHGGQLNYIQLLYGDTEFRVPQS